MNFIFQKIFESSPIAKVIVDSEYIIRFVNVSAAFLFGFQEEEIIGKDVSLLLYEDDAYGSTVKARDFFKPDQQIKLDKQKVIFGLKKNGKKFPIDIALTPFDNDGHYYVMGSIIDLTRQFIAEEKFRAVVESAPNGMLMINQKGRIVLVNRQIEDMFAYERKELVGQQVEILVPGEFKKHHPQFVANFINTPKHRSMGIGRELFGKRKNGTLFPLEIILQPLEDNNEQIRILASVVDITKRRKAEQEIKEKSDELKEFAYRTSHDLKAPLVTMAAILRCAEEDMNEGDHNEVLANIKKAQQISMNLQALVQSILFLTRADLGTEEKTDFDFEGFIEKVFLHLKFQIESHKIKLETHFHHQASFKTYESKFSQILENLISNAIKFHKKDSGHRFIKLLSYDDMEYFYFQVMDNGVGIPSQKHEEVFTMFKRFHHNVEGHGIGLYMVKKFVTKLGGSIRFESSPEGTCFYLKFAKENKS